ALLRASAAPADAFARDPVWLARMVAQTQAQGYGMRDPAMTGEGRGRSPMPDDGRNSIAVPVIVAGQVVASLNLTWTRRAASVGQIVSEYLADLRGAAAEMARELAG